jgi:tRNA(Ile)-lysidine synthase
MSPALDPFAGHVRRFLINHDLVANSDPLLIGISGGPDSVSLLAACVEIQDRVRIQIHAVHVNHGLRGKASHADAEYVRRLCRRFSVPVTVVPGPVDGYREPPGRVSVEVAARYARYAVFADVARQRKAKALLIAHTADDQVETILMNLMRGAGLRGTSGMRPITRLPQIPGQPNPPAISLARPLLDVPRTEVKRYLRYRRLRPRLDGSNTDPRHLRNRVRNELIPLMESLRAGSGSGLLRAATASAEAEEALVSVVDGAWQDAVDVETISPGLFSVAISPNQLRNDGLPRMIRIMVYTRALETVAGTREGFGARHLDAIDRLLHGRTGSLNLPHSVLVTRSQDALTLSIGPTTPRRTVRRSGTHGSDTVTGKSEEGNITP